MIRIRRPAEAPGILRTRGKAKRRALCSLFTRFARDYRSGTRRFQFDRAIYSGREVKGALIRAQHGKCAFCESKIRHVAYGDVEHYRPKAGFRQGPGEELQRPGYYWLAYEWGNLLLSCQLCNQRFKGSLFPLADPDRRARLHKDDVAQEDPLLIDPATEEPEQFISFHDEVPYAVDADARGLATIAALGLDRDELSEMRRDLLAQVRARARIVQLAAERPDDSQVQACAAAARRILRDARRDDAQYAGMVRANFGTVA